MMAFLQIMLAGWALLLVAVLGAGWRAGRPCCPRETACEYCGDAVCDLHDEINFRECPDGCITCGCCWANHQRNCRTCQAVMRLDREAS